MSTEIALATLSIVFGIIGYLLQKKDEAQESKIKELQESARERAEKNRLEFQQLWSKHDEDAQRLHLLEVEIAKQYYPKVELDKRFHDLEKTVSEGLKAVTEAVHELSRELTAIMRSGNNTFNNINQPK